MYVSKNNSGPKVSVIMNCFNGAKYMSEAIDSIFRQTHKNWEIIFIDNCSTDESAEIAKSYGNQIKYYKTTKNIPLYAARNFALDFISGDFVAFLDVDDLWLEDKLERQIALFDDPNVGFVFTGVDYITNKGDKIKRKHPTLKRGVITQSLLLRNFIAISSSMVRASVFKQSRFVSEYNLLGDHHFWLKISMFTRADFVSDKLFLCRLHEDSTTNKNKGKWIIEMRKQYREFIKVNGFKYPNIFVYILKCELGHFIGRF
ncbi:MULTISPECIES: glycosyltransferase family 2 protein [Vibrio]|uniref:glycosyltransferase family 2 protein n=1 Tax=Vibrio TaxID=662 RepID=UPI0022CD82B6|nr:MULTISPECIES: glycosyltransferase [unclassified Vibrio]MDA0119792.1 glycosyltransferase [Vibrio sp. T11.5]